MIHAQISIYPIGTNTVDTGFYVAKAVEAIQNTKGLKHQITAMGIILEAENIDIINETTKKMSTLVHNLGVNRVQLVIKIDSQIDGQKSLQEVTDDIKKHLN